MLLRKFILMPMVLTVLAALALPASASERAPKGITHKTDDIWAGYLVNYANPDPNTDPMAANGSWTVPKVSCTNSAGKPITGQTATWVGLGGVGANNLEQIGVDSQCKLGKASYWAWIEAPSAYTPVIQINLTNSNGKGGAPGVDCKGKAPVSAGDYMEATVTDQGFGQFAFQIWDNTKGWYCPALWEDNNADAVPETADWVVEDVYTLNFPQFKQPVTWFGCNWTQDSSTSPLFAAANITQLDIFNKSLGVSKTKTSEIGGASFKVQWLHI